MEVSYILNPVISSDAEDQEITVYYWPGYIGEYNSTTMVFEAWELRGPTQWIPCPAIHAPPRDCLASETVLTKRWCQALSQWSLLTTKEGSVGRRLAPRVVS